MEHRFELAVRDERIIGIHHQIKGKSDSCVISCHGLLASKDSIKYSTLGRVLSSQEIPVVRFDFRGCGESSGKLSEGHVTKRLKDLDLVIDYLKNEYNYTNFGLFGSSMGAFISYQRASLDKSIKAIVSLASPYSMKGLFEKHRIDNDHFEIDGIIFGRTFIDDIMANGELTPELLGEVHCPVYIFQGNFDGLVPVDHAYKIYNELKCEKEISIIPGGDHIFSYPKHLEKIISVSSDWFNKYLAGG